MSSCNLSIHDLRFRRTGEDQCDIVVFGQTLGTVTRRPDIASPDGGWYYVVHLFDDHRGPRHVDDLDRVRAVAAATIAERDLAPSMPPPVHPDFPKSGHPPA